MGSLHSFYLSTNKAFHKTGLRLVGPVFSINQHQQAIEVQMTNEVKFALYGYNGKPKGFYIARPTLLPTPPVSSEMGHHIVIIDRSGSMWGSPITETKVMVEKVFTLEEYNDSELLVSLISYSSNGDYTVHFERIAVSEVMKPGSAHVENIRKIQATYLTCASQALDYAKTLVRPDETTAISLHTDGYFNDASPATEARKIDGFIASMQDVKNVFVNTIAYGYADTGILMKLANALSGKCIPAKTVKGVYDALHDTTALLAGRSTPPMTIEIDGADYQALVSVSARKVNGTTTDLKVRGLKNTDDVTIWRYRKVTEEKWNESALAVAEKDGLQPVYAFIRSKLAEGQVNTAKYALMATRNLPLIEVHAKALTVEQRAAFAMDVESYLVGEQTCFLWGTSYGMDMSKASVLEVCTLLGNNRDSWLLDLPEFMKGYRKRGLKRIAGKWDKETGKLVLPATKLVPNDTAEIVSVSSFRLNNDTANLNMLVYRDADLCDYGTGKVNRVVAGKKLDMKELRSYTLVGDGAVNALTLPIRIANKSVFASLASTGVVSGDYSPTQRYDIALSELPVLSYDMDFGVPSGVYEKMLGLKVLSSLYAACLPDGVKGEAWTPEQLLELESKNLTSGLNYSPSTSNPYTDLEEAIRKGEVDTRTSYTIEVMNKEIAGLKQLYSANEYLNRRFTVTLPNPGDKELAKGESWLKKATLVDALSEGAVVKEKVLTAKVAAGLDAIDALTMPVFSGFFANPFPTKEVMAESKRSADWELEKLHAELRPIGFYIGATGLIPEAWGDVAALTGEKIVEKYPALSLSKAQKEATFFEVGATIVAVYATNVNFSTPIGVEKAKALMNGSDEEVE